jgi:AraC-like DNA-binding protein
MDDSDPQFFSRQIVRGRRFYLRFAKAGRVPLAVVAGGFETCSPGYLIDREKFPYFALELVAGGEGEVELNGRTHPLQAGTIFAYDRDTPHRIVSSADPLRKYFLTFVGRTARELLAEAHLAPGTCRTTSRLGQLRVVWDEVLELGARPGPDAEERATHGLRFILAILAHSPHEGGAAGRAQATLRRCEAYLQQNFLRIHRLQEVAEACHVDLPYLCRLSRRFLGQTPYQYLLHLKMSYAAERLQGDRLVREVAEELNLDPFQFSRTFKRVHGIAPAEFQRLYLDRRGLER